MLSSYGECSSGSLLSSRAVELIGSSLTQFVLKYEAARHTVNE